MEAAVSAGFIGGPGRQAYLEVAVVTGLLANAAGAPAEPVQTCIIDTPSISVDAR